MATSHGLCELHSQEKIKQAQKQRVNKWLPMYKNVRWQRMRLNQLAKEPLCCECLKENRLTPATVADHIKPHGGDPALFYDPRNLQSMCEHHHSIKSAKEDGSFGNPKKAADHDMHDMRKDG
jgi:5-methylcytosine-specific restriction protein A